MWNQHSNKILRLDLHNNQIKFMIIWFYTKDKSEKNQKLYAMILVFLGH
jgi:hypothetical protein